MLFDQKLSKSRQQNLVEGTYSSDASSCSLLSMVCFPLTYPPYCDLRKFKQLAFHTLYTELLSDSADHDEPDRRCQLRLCAVRTWLAPGVAAESLRLWHVFGDGLIGHSDVTSRPATGCATLLEFYVERAWW
jgi:hypothetical protein